MTAPLVTTLKPHCFLLVTLLYDPMRARYNGADVAFCYAADAHLVIWQPQAGHQVAVYPRDDDGDWRGALQTLPTFHALDQSPLHCIAASDIDSLFDALAAFAVGLEETTQGKST